MVGKSGVWAHFGSWDFDRAYYYYRLKDLPIDEAVKLAEQDLGYDEAKARALYLEVQRIQNENDANAWISPWPSYLTSTVSCTENAVLNLVGCQLNVNVGSQNGLQLSITRLMFNLSDIKSSSMLLQAVNPSTGTAVSQNTLRPEAIVVADEKGMTKITLENSTVPYEVLLYKDKDGNYKTLIAQDPLAESMFTRLFFLEGAYTKHFQKISDENSFRNLRIITYKVNFGSRDEELN